jgi:hypothetical protein
MTPNKVIEDNIIEYYSDFHALHHLRDCTEGTNYVGDYDPWLCKEIQSIVYKDLMSLAKSDIIHYILDDVFNVLDWDYINKSLQDWYFAEDLRDD